MMILTSAAKTLNFKYKDGDFEAIKSNHNLSCHLNMALSVARNVQVIRQSLIAPLLPSILIVSLLLKQVSASHLFPTWLMRLWPYVTGCYHDILWLKEKNV